MRAAPSALTPLVQAHPEFEAALNDAIGAASANRKPANVSVAAEPAEDAATKRGKNRRTPAVFDPVQVVRDGETALRDALAKLSLEQFRDIVAEYGMDQGRLVMKWVSTERVIDRIVEMSISRAHKGSAFRKPADEQPLPNPEAIETQPVGTESPGPEGAP